MSLMILGIDCPRDERVGIDHIGRAVAIRPDEIDLVARLQQTQIPEDHWAITPPVAMSGDDSIGPFAGTRE